MLWIEKISVFNTFFDVTDCKISVVLMMPFYVRAKRQNLIKTWSSLLQLSGKQ